METAMPKATKTIQTEAERRLLHALAGMCEQYLSETHNGTRVLDHMFMSAGEGAFDQLFAYGLIDGGEGRIVTWTADGEALLNWTPRVDLDRS